MSEISLPPQAPEVSDGTIRLRAHRSDDVPRIVERCRDEQSLRWTQVPRDYTAQMGEDWIALIGAQWADHDSLGDRSWAIEEVQAGTGHYCGTIDLRPRPGGRAEVGYALHPDARNRGLMARALRLVSSWWFERGGQRIDWYAERGNFASWTAARAAGFDYVATLPGHIPNGEGRLVDAWFGTLARSDSGTPVKPWFKPPVLAGGGVRLRPWGEADAASNEPHNHPAHHVPPHAIPTPETFNEWLLARREHMAFGRGMHWCIADVDTDRALGDVCLFGFADDHSGELGYFLFPAARGTGAAAVAAGLVAGWALAPVSEAGFGLARLVALTSSDNRASESILRAIGFTKTGHEPGFSRLADGSTVDATRWTRLAAARDTAIAVPGNADDHTAGRSTATSISGE